MVTLIQAHQVAVGEQVNKYAVAALLECRQQHPHKHTEFLEVPRLVRDFFDVCVSPKGAVMALNSGLNESCARRSEPARQNPRKRGPLTLATELSHPSVLAVLLLCFHHQHLLPIFITPCHPRRHDVCDPAQKPGQVILSTHPERHALRDWLSIMDTTGIRGGTSTATNP